MNPATSNQKFQWIPFCQTLQQQQNVENGGKKGGKQSKKKRCDVVSKGASVPMSRVLMKKVNAIQGIQVNLVAYLPYIKSIFVDILMEVLQLVNNVVNKELPTILAYITICMEGLQQYFNLLDNMIFGDHHIYGILYHSLRHLPIRLNHISHTIFPIAYSNISTTTPALASSINIVEEITTRMKMIEDLSARCFAIWQVKEKTFYQTGLAIIQHPVRKPNLFQLQEDMHSYYQIQLSYQPMIEQQNMVVKNDLLTFLNNHWRNEYFITCEFFGSRISRLATPQSDLDISLSFFQLYRDGSYDLLPIIIDNRPNGRDGNNKLPPQGVTCSYLLKKIRNLCYNPRAPFTCKELISWARVPIIKLIHKATGVEVDICLENQLGVQNTLILRDAVRADPRIHQLLLTIKYWASQRCLNQSSHGTLSTFSWCVLVLYFVTHITQPSLLHPVEITAEGQNIISFYHQQKEKKLAVHCGTGSFFRLSSRKDGGITGLGNQLPNTKTVIELLLEFIQFYGSDYLFNSFDYYHEMISLVHPTRSSFHYYDNTQRKFFPFPEQARFTTITSELYSSSNSLIPSTTTVIGGTAATVVAATTVNTNMTVASLDGGATSSLLFTSLTCTMKEMRLDPPDLLTMMRNAASPSPSIGPSPHSNIRTTSSSSSFIMMDGNSRSHHSAGHNRATNLAADIPSSPNSNSTNSSQNGMLNPLWLLSGLLEGDDDDSRDEDSITNELQAVAGEENNQGTVKGHRAQTTITTISSADDNDALLDALIEEDKRNTRRRKEDEAEDENDHDDEEEEEENSNSDENEEEDDETDAVAADECATTITSLTNTTMTSLTNSNTLDMDQLISLSKKEKKAQNLAVKVAKKEQARKKKLEKKFLRNLEKQSIIKIQDPFEGFNLGRVVHNLDVQCILQSELRRYYYLLMTENSPNLWQALNEKHRFIVTNNATGNRGRTGNKPSNIATEDEFIHCASCRSIGHSTENCFVACCAKCKQVGHKENACVVVPCPYCKRYDHDASSCKRKPPASALPIPPPPQNDTVVNNNLKQPPENVSRQPNEKKQTQSQIKRENLKAKNDSNVSASTVLHDLPPNPPSQHSAPRTAAPVTVRKIDVLKTALNLKSLNLQSHSELNANNTSAKSKPHK